MILGKSRFSSDRIYLIGYMASGKSTLGKLLADHLNFDFVDTDIAIEKLNGLSVQSIFETKGESWFREEETRIIKFASELDKAVISVGGGLPIYNNNLTVLLQSGTTIYLELTAEELAERIIRDNQIRPLHSKEVNLQEAISKKLSDRKTFYQEAHITVNGNRSTEELANILTAKIRGEN